MQTQLAQIPGELRELAALDGPGEVIVTRRLGKDGRNRCYVNDTAVTLSAMAGVVGGLLSFAGQHEYRRLLDPAYQLAVLDQWAGPAALAAGRGVPRGFRRGPRQQPPSGGEPRARADRLREIELLRFQTAELEAAKLSLEDEAALQAEQRVLAGPRTCSATGPGRRAAERARSPAADAAGARRASGGPCGRAGGSRPGGGGLRRPPSGRRSTPLTELSRELRHYVDRVTVDPARLQAVDERLRVYTDLGRKYGGSTEAAVAYLQESSARLAAPGAGRRKTCRGCRRRREHAARWRRSSWRARSPRRAARPRRRSKRPWRRNWPTWVWPRRS